MHDPSPLTSHDASPAAAGCLAPLRAARHHLAGLTGGAPPFLSAPFFLWTARFLCAGGEPVLASAWAGGRPAAALPLLLRGRTLRALASPQTPRYDLCGDAAALPGLWAALRNDDGWDILQLGTVPDDSPLCTDLPELARRDGCRVIIRPGSRSPRFPLADFERGLDAKFRGNLRRRGRKLGDYQLERVTRYDRQALHDVFRLEAAAWKGEAGTAILSSPDTRRFYTALSRSLAPAGRFSLAFLRLQGERIAGHVVLEDRDTYYLYKPGYDPRFAAFGPGHLLVYETARDAAARGLHTYDFLGVDQPWKLEWTSIVQPHVRITVYRPTVRGRVLHAVREVIRPRLGVALRGGRRILRERLGRW